MNGILELESRRARTFFAWPNTRKTSYFFIALQVVSASFVWLDTEQAATSTPVSRNQAPVQEPIADPVKDVSAEEPTTSALLPKKAQEPEKSPSTEQGRLVIRGGKNFKGATVWTVFNGKRRAIPSVPITLGIELAKEYRVYAQQAGFKDFEQTIVVTDDQVPRELVVALQAIEEPKPVRRDPSQEQ